ncbi:MAG TPA: adenylate kinase [Deltaproteobacteria bacterium]|nr:adenylate kinase [Deltaproteobacteria bacterium]
MNLIFLGAPGAGKGTQAQRIAEKYAIPQVSTGDILRRNVREGTELGRRAREYMDRGALVPDELVVAMVAERLGEPDCAQGFILDGFPRNISQAEALERTLGSLGRELDRVIGIEVDSEELVKRLSGRRVCRSCGASYHVVYNPSKAEGLCDRCGGETYQRDDDKEETIKARLAVYERETLPLVEYYRGKGLYRAVNGVGDVDAVTRAVVDAIGR